MTLSFTPRTGVALFHGPNPKDTLRLLRRLELGSDLDLEIIIGVPEGHVDVPALADGLRGRGTLRSIDPSLSVPAGANVILADMIGKGIQYAWILGPELRPTPATLSILTRHMARMPDCAAVGPRILQHTDSRPVIWSDGGVVSGDGQVGRISAGVKWSGAPKARAVDVDAVPFPGSLYRVSAVATLGPFGDSDIVDGHDVGWSNRARRAGWRVMVQRRARSRLVGVDG